MKNGEGKGVFHGVWQSFTGADKKVGLVLAVGLAGMLLVLLSTFLPAGSSKSTGRASGDADAQYLSQTEQRLLGLVSSIAGVGKAKVLVTLENGREYVYAKEYKSANDRSVTYEGGQPAKSQENVSGEQKYILMDVNGTGDQALLLTQVEPKIKGVVVVCEGAGNPVVSQRVISAVTTALGISSTKVCVLQIAS